MNEIELDDEAIITPIRKLRKVIMYGDSITQGYDAAKSSLSYASRLADTLNADVVNKGIGGSVFMPELARCKGNILPEFINSAGKMRAFEISRCGKNKIPELSYQPRLLGCVGPFFDGYTCGGSVAVIRYEKKY